MKDCGEMMREQVIVRSNKHFSTHTICKESSKVGSEEA